MNFIQKTIYAGVILSMFSTPNFSDEGMWTPDNLPLAKIKEKYNKSVSRKLLDKIRLSSVRFNDGGSGSFVSSTGLILTNHHVAMGQLQKLSTKKNDYVKNGFYAKTSKEEMKCPDLEINILVSLENVTDTIQNYYKNKTDNSEIHSLKKEIIAKLEKESLQKTGFRSDVVELYEGGEFWIYRYKKFTDIRLVFAPELQAASFGGDPDNFQFPRYDLDFTFFRAYENGKPYISPDFLKWDENGPKEGELSFVSGHPGSTDRHKTVSQLEYMRDYSFPTSLGIIRFQLEKFRNFSNKGKEEKRIIQDSILGLENSFKAINGEYQSLLDPVFFRKMKEKEELLISQTEKSNELSKKYRDSWNNINKIQEKLTKKHKEIYFTRVGGKLNNYALGLIRYAMEIEKPNEKRYEEFRDSSLDSWKHRFLSSAPIYEKKEILSFLVNWEIVALELGTESEFWKTGIGEEDPIALAEKLISQTKLKDPKFRKTLIEKGSKFILENEDPLLVWMKKLEPFFRKNRDWIENEIETPLSVEGARQAQLKFDLYGKSTYPDATFTLRLSFGTMKGYEVDGWKVPPFTTFHGLIERSIAMRENPPFQLSDQIKKNLNKINLQTPLNFVSTHDITGGNSGSPVISTKGNLIGLIFDGNAYSHSGNYLYTDEKSRSVSVHSGAIIEALKNIYGAKKLADELLQ